ncbi:hypothetical protein [Crocinitomix catalasitica]|uniref:hypothetical protein n=1 Tax=Crocinitomix catalasitica TaxID=184607 RepID=UPI000484CDE4|nr:hypothetical protein [Crocinitomix catalasitica]
MTHTFHIDGSSQKAKALLEFLRTLEFVKEVEQSDVVLTDEQLRIVEERRKNRLNGTSTTQSWQDVKGNLGQIDTGL